MASPQKQAVADSGCRDNTCRVDGKVYPYTDGINGTVYGNGTTIDYTNLRKPTANYMKSSCNSTKKLPSVSC